MPSIGRNSPCPCGSGKKFKRCCGVSGSQQTPADGIPVYRQRVALTIATAEDLQPYCDAFVRTFHLLLAPRTEALLHSLRAVQTFNGVGYVLGDEQPTHYRRMRASQDLLRYLAYEIATKSPAGGLARSTTMAEFRLASRTAKKFAEIARVRDFIRAVQVGWGDVVVEAATRTITFVMDDALALHATRQQELLNERAKNDERAREASTQLAYDLRSAFPDLIKSVQIDTRTASFSFQLEARFTAALRAAIGAHAPHVLDSDALPADWSLGPYTVADYRAFYLELQVLAALQLLVFNEIVDQGSGFVPYNSSIVLRSDAQIAEHMSRYAGLSSEVVAELARDLHYSPEVVPWTEPEYQPMIPVGDDHSAFIEVVVGGSNYERNLLALADRLPWRKAQAHQLKEGREQLMIDQLEPKLAARGWFHKPRVLLGTQKNRIGDIDLLVWTTAPAEVLACSLKWFYGPDSVQEVWNHSQEYRRALAKLRIDAQYLQAHLESTSRDRRLSPPLSTRSVVFAVLVTYQDELLFQDRADDIPSLTLLQFTRLADDFRGSISEFFQELREISTRRPSLLVRPGFETVQLDSYRFRLPISYFREPSGEAE